MHTSLVLYLGINLNSFLGHIFIQTMLCFHLSPLLKLCLLCSVQLFSQIMCSSGHEIAPVANATKIIVLATKIQKLVAKLATRTLLVLYILPWCRLQLSKALVDESAQEMRSVKQNRHKCYEPNICHLWFSKCYVVYCEVKCPFWLHRHFTSKLGKPYHLTLLYNAFFQLSFFLMAPNFLGLATTLENLGARWFFFLPKELISCSVAAVCGVWRNI